MSKQPFPLPLDGDMRIWWIISYVFRLSTLMLEKLVQMVLLFIAQSVMFVQRV